MSGASLLIGGATDILNMIVQDQAEAEALKNQTGPESIVAPDLVGYQNRIIDADIEKTKKVESALTFASIGIGAIALLLLFRGK